MTDNAHSLVVGLPLAGPESLPIDVLLVGRLDAARVSGVSPASWDRLTAAGGTPASITLGRRVLWRRSDLEAWVRFRCPDRKTFEILVESEG